MGKIIIDNKTDLDMEDIFTLIHSVISAGRISNNGKQYCYLTVFEHNKREIHIASDLNRKSDKFTIYERGKNEKKN